MIKKSKRILSLILSVLMVITMLPTFALTVSAATLTETDIANATTNRVVIKDAIYTYAGSGTYYNYGTTISTESDWNTPITSTSTITKVECLDDASVLSVTDGKLSGSFSSNTFKVSDATNVFATLKFTFSDGKVEYHKVAVKSYPVENHIACFGDKRPRIGSYTENGYTMFMRGSTGSGGNGVWSYQKNYKKSGTEQHGKPDINGTTRLSADKNAYSFAYGDNNSDAVPSPSFATYYVDKSCKNTNWSALGNSELWNGTNYVVPIEIVRTKFLYDLGTANWDFDLNCMPVANKLVRTDSNGRNNDNGTTYGLTFTHNSSVSSSDKTSSSENTNIRIALRTLNNGWVLMKTNLVVNLFDKSVARNLYTTCLNSAVDGSEYTASSFLAYQNALLEMEAYLSNYEDTTDATTSQTVYTNLNNAKNNLKSLYCTVTFANAMLEQTTVKVREGATVPSEQFPTLAKTTQQSNKTQHRRYFFKNTADGTEFTAATVVTSDVSVIESSTLENCSGGTATCTSLAVCDVCNSTYGSTTGHNLTETVAKDATCTKAGNSAYWTCSDCGKMFLNADATTEITEVPTIPATNEHNYTVLQTAEVPATCTTTGTTAVMKCATCDATTGGEEIAIDPNAHNFGSEWVSNGDGTHTHVCQYNPSHKAANYACFGGIATCTEAANCDGCGSPYGDPLGHDYVYAQLDADNHKVTCSRCDYKSQAPHSFDENNTCTKCLYEKSTIDTSAYDNAVTDYNETITDSNYAAKYTAESRKAYEKAVDAAKKDSFATQEEVNAAVATILEAKTMLCLANIEINVYVAKEDGTSNSVDTITRPYGTKVPIDVEGKLAANQMISKWTIETKESSVTTKLSTVESAIEIVATEPTDVYVHVVESKSTEIEPVVYSKVSFISKNGAVSSVEYVKKGETLNTDEVEGVKIPFYKFIGWSKASVTGTGEDIEVKAIYEFIEAEVNMCTVHYNGTSTKYAYDKFVYIYGAENDKLALSTTNDESGIITYLNENAFYAPHVDEIYVIEVDTQKASIGITGTYFLPANEKGKKTFAFNCKMFLPEGCELVEAGAILKTATATKKAKAEKISARGEYTIKVTSSTAEYVEGKAYLTYKDSNDNHLYTIYTDAQTITEA